MAEISVKINVAAIKRKFENHVEKNQKVAEYVDRKIKSLFERAHSALMREFLNHPVTKELIQSAKNPASGTNISGTLGGYGNLFTFLGFWFEKDPTKALENLLKKGFSANRTVRRKNFLYYRVHTPTPEQIKDASPMDWHPQVSWAYAVENGNFSGAAEASHYIFKTWLSSRSTHGIQIKHDYSSISFRETPYLSEILNNFKEKMNNIRV